MVILGAMRPGGQARLEEFALRLRQYSHSETPLDCSANGEPWNTLGNASRASFHFHFLNRLLAPHQLFPFHRPHHRFRTLLQPPLSPQFPLPRGETRKQQLDAGRESCRRPILPSARPFFGSHLGAHPSAIHWISIGPRCFARRPSSRPPQCSVDILALGNLHHPPSCLSFIHHTTRGLFILSYSFRWRVPFRLFTLPCLPGSFA